MFYPHNRFKMITKEFLLNKFSMVMKGIKSLFQHVIKLCLKKILVKRIEVMETYMGFLFIFYACLIIVLWSKNSELRISSRSQYKRCFSKFCDFFDFFLAFLKVQQQFLIFEKKRLKLYNLLTDKVLCFAEFLECLIRWGKKFRLVPEVSINVFR